MKILGFSQKKIGRKGEKVRAEDQERIRGIKESKTAKKKGKRPEKGRRKLQKIFSAES